MTTTTWIYLIYAFSGLTFGLGLAAVIVRFRFPRHSMRVAIMATMAMLCTWAVLFGACWFGDLRDIATGPSYSTFRDRAFVILCVGLTALPIAAFGWLEYALGGGL